MKGAGESRVTVLLPVRDGEAFLGEALASLAAQTLTDFEVLVVDDGSTDGTASLVAAASRGDARFRLVPNRGRGLVDALRTGLDQVDTEFVARMDADDVSRPDRLAAQADFLDREPDLAGCGARVVAGPGGPATPRGAAYLRWLNGMTTWDAVARDLFVECPLAHPTFFFRTSAVRTAGGYRDREWPEDYDLLLRMWRRGLRFVALDRTLLEWRDRPERLSRTHPSYTLEAFRRCRVHHLGKSHLADGRAVAVWGSGPTGKAFARACREAGVTVALFCDVDPRKVGQEIYGIPVVGPEEASLHRGLLHLGAVARSEGRESVRAMAREAGLEEGVDFVSVA